MKSGKTRKGVILKAGSVFVKAAQKILKEDNSSFVLKTKYASMGVRGTEFFTAYADSARNKAKEDIWMCVKEGQVVIKNRKTKNKNKSKPRRRCSSPLWQKTPRRQNLLPGRKN